MSQTNVDNDDRAKKTSYKYTKIKAKKKKTRLIFRMSNSDNRN